MALPFTALGSSLSLGDIRAELGLLSTSAGFSITTAATRGYVALNRDSRFVPNNTAPHAVSEWDGYDHNATPSAFLSISPTSKNLSATPSVTYEISVSSNVTWAISPSSVLWVSATKVSNSLASVSVESNFNTTSRSTSLTFSGPNVSDVTHTIFQEENTGPVLIR